MPKLTAIENLDELFAHLVNRTIELTDCLPTFGGPDVEDTNEIWSWDEMSMITGTCVDDLVLELRDDL